jgi:hypothetical protein
VRFDWCKEDVCKKRLSDFILSKKLTARMDDFFPGEEWQERHQGWKKATQTWQAKVTAYKSAVQMKAKAKIAKQLEKEKRKQAQEQLKAIKARQAKAIEMGKAKKREEALKKAAEEGVELPDEPEEEAEPKAEEEEAKEEEASEEEKEDVDDYDGLDVFGVEDVCDIGNKRPLVTAFQSEDWTLMNLRAELHHMLIAFAKDVKDHDRNQMHIDNVAFYYQKYYKKPLNFKLYGVENITELLPLVRDTVRLVDEKVVTTILPNLDTFNVFAMITEECRRDRVRRLDIGDETAKLAIAQTPGQTLAFSGGGSIFPAQGWPAQANQVQPAAATRLAQAAAVAPANRPTGLQAPAGNLAALLSKQRMGVAKASPVAVRPVGAFGTGQAVRPAVRPAVFGSRPMFSSLARPRG